ncbi:flagellar export protein FliJ [Noviherbaspirillum cavernae]|uniref:Flagellar FliJ protein n=1 Tax=Noviherbaspirillum cavernae TaxID=2320862 RepID=A0A418WVM6_9BURK|nr:flagellar FliJ family protein [Noviherbaspirillum cavernae]RJF96703.1 flagellar export protein FliJ [Noviherbaspirillum cavernae]
MTQPSMKSLSTLVTLRAREVDRLQADIAAKTAVRQRYLNNLQRMEGLCAAGGASGALPLALSLNCGNYKQSVMEMADAHRVELGLHEADMAVTQRALAAAWCKQEVLGKVLEQQERRVLSAQEKTERKRQDELATQMWHREQQ